MQWLVEITTFQVGTTGPAESQKIPEYPGVNRGREIAVRHADLAVPSLQTRPAPRRKYLASANSIRSVSLFIVRPTGSGLGAFAARLSSTFDCPHETASQTHLAVGT
jgi:hypothetical protein